MRNPVVPLRLSPEVPSEARIRELYDALPRERRMGFLRSLLEMGLSVYEAQASGETSVHVASRRPVLDAAASPVSAASAAPVPSPVAVKPADLAPTPKLKAPVLSVSPVKANPMKAKEALAGFLDPQ